MGSCPDPCPCAKNFRFSDYFTVEIFAIYLILFPAPNDEIGPKIEEIRKRGNDKLGGKVFKIRKLFPVPFRGAGSASAMTHPT